ncbi:Transposase [Shigella dysenteriae CDC 74-1112]|nr:Transposase [Shigella dysenteriae CDC 74-1112]
MSSSLPDDINALKRLLAEQEALNRALLEKLNEREWICPYISRHLLSLNPLQARCRRYSRGER